MTDQELKDLVASLSVNQDRAKREQEKRDAHLDGQLDTLIAANVANVALMAESSRKLDKVAALVGNIGQNQGAVAEEFFFNSLQAKPVLGGVHYDEVIDNLKGYSGKLRGEYDVVMVNGKSVALIEVKYVVHPDDITKTIKGIENYRTFFPQHKDFDVYGAIAGFKIPDEVADAAKQQGLMVLKRVGDVMEVDTGEPHRF